jgi:hypothetical protein
LKGEFRAAFEEAQKLNIPVILGDRPMEGFLIHILISTFHFRSEQNENFTLISCCTKILMKDDKILIYICFCCNVNSNFEAILQDDPTT